MTIDLNPTSRRNYTKSPESLARPKTVPTWPDYEQLNRLFEFGRGLLKNIYPHSTIRKATKPTPELHFGDFILTCYDHRAFTLRYNTGNSPLVLVTDCEVQVYQYLKAFIDANNISTGNGECSVVCIEPKTTNDPLSDYITKEFPTGVNI